MQPISLYDLFERHPKAPEAMPPLGRRVLHYLDIAGERLSELNKAFYEAIKGQPFVHLQGTTDRYAILGGFRKRHIEEIRDKTGWLVSWPLGVGYRRQGAKHEGQKRPSYRTKGSTGTFRIGYAFGTQEYVGIKITEGDASEYEFQKALEQIPHILYARDRCIGVGPKGEEQLYQVMNLAGLGSVDKLRHSILSLTDLQFKEHLQFYLTKGLLMGLHYMHILGLYHLDVKPENFVVTHKGEVLLIDFGCSRKGDKGLVDCSTRDSDGDERYFSPERWLASYGVGHLCDGGKIDAWAAGVTLVEILTGKEDLFDVRQIRKLAAQAGREQGRAALLRHFAEQLLEIPELFDPDTDGPWAVVVELLAIDPAKRITVGEALQYRWFACAMTSFLPQKEKTLGHLVELVQNRSISAVIGSNKAEEAANPLSPQQHPLPHFTDYVNRLQLESTLVERLLSNTSCTALQGMGGVGKSQLALYLFHSPKVKEHFGLRFWFRAADQTGSLDSQFQVLAMELRLVKEAATPEEAITAFHGYLAQQTSPYLLAFDNADDPNRLAPYLLQGNGHILITTRNASWSDTVPIDVLSKEESLLLIGKLLQKEDPSSSKLVETLGHLPLGLSQSCAYIRNHNLAVSDYLHLLSQNTSSLIQQNESLFGKDLPLSMGAVWETTFRTVQKECPAALALLDAVSYLAPDAIPEGLIFALGNYEGLQATLLRYALLSKAGENYAVHRLTQAIRKSKHDPQAQRYFLRSTLIAFTSAFDPDKASKAEIRLFLPHGEMLGKGLAKYGPQSIDILTLQTFFEYIGRSHIVLQQYRSGVRAWEECLRVSIFLGEKAWEGTASQNLGNAYSGLGEYRKAIPFHEKCLQIAKDAKYKVGQVMAYGNLGNAYGHLGEYKNAISFHKKCLQIVIELGDEDLAAHAYSGLGGAYSNLRKFGKAIEYHEKGLQIARRLKDKEGKGRAYGGLGKAYYGLGEYKRAIEFHEKCLKIVSELEDRQGRELVYCNLGIAYASLGQYRKAIEVLEKSRQIAIRLEDKAGEGRACCNLGLFYESLGEYRKAIEFLERHLQIALELKDRIGAGKAYANLGMAYQGLGGYEKAIECYRFGYEMIVLVMGEKHPATLHLQQKINEVRKLLMSSKN
ncbi:MAG: tetratricopeptide repeat protein [Parachlamydiales bacterium]